MLSHVGTCYADCRLRPFVQESIIEGMGRVPVEIRLKQHPIIMLPLKYGLRMSSQPCYPEKASVVDTLLDTLAHNVRREVIYYFEQCTGAETVAFAELVRHIDDRTPGQDSDGLEIELVHSHLPKLAERDWLEYDRQSGEIRYYGHDCAKQLTREVHEIF